MKRTSIMNGLTALAVLLSLTVLISPAFGGSSKTSNCVISGDSQPTVSYGAYGKAKNIIFMVPDGMGLADVTAARIFKYGPNGDSLEFEKFTTIGYQRTHSLNATVTDSAAAATAWAMGKKVDNNEVSFHNGSWTDTILELAKKKGKATGLVATSTITHATPAAFGAHVFYRNCETDIAEQYIYDTKVDVLLGGGIGSNRSPSSGTLKCDPDATTGDDVLELIDKAVDQKGYVLVRNKAELNYAVSYQPRKILGIFTSDYPTGAKTPEMFRVDDTPYPEDEPTLAELIKAALDILENDRNGFFVMIEGSQIDWGNHANDVNYQIAETLAFDEAVKEVKNWVSQKGRSANTLIIVVADHECGGFAINGPGNALSLVGDIVEAGWTSEDHTAVDTIVWSEGPGSTSLGKALDNTDLFNVMKGILQ